jgi:hypothetical protein
LLNNSENISLPKQAIILPRLLVIDISVTKKGEVLKDSTSATTLSITIRLHTILKTKNK